MTNTPVGEQTSETKSSLGAPRTRVGDLRPGEGIESTYHLSTVEKRSKKNGEPFFFMTFQDSTGSVKGVMWDGHEALLDGSIRQDDFVWIEGHSADYKGELQITVRQIRPLDDTEVDFSEFLPVSPRPREEMEAQLDELIAQVKQADCRRLLDKFFGHDRFRESFCSAPAAVRIHQAYLGGLLEHTLNVIHNALALAVRYEPVDRDLLITGGLLHDIGKIREYDWSRSIVYTDEGRLVGHITIGATMVDAAVRVLQREKEGFSEHYRQHVLHLLLSHHGKLEFGSPTVPKSREALLLHYADYADAYLTSYADSVDEARQRGESWTPYNRMFESYLFAGGPPGGMLQPAASGISDQPSEEHPDES